LLNNLERRTFCFKIFERRAKHKIAQKKSNNVSTQIKVYAFLTIFIYFYKSYNFIYFSRAVNFFSKKSRDKTFGFFKGSIYYLKSFIFHFFWCVIVSCHCPTKKIKISEDLNFYIGPLALRLKNIIENSNPKSLIFYLGP
jgi:hypothetical protein